MYEEIRPYTDAEVQPVLQRLIRDVQLLNLLAGYRLPRLHRYAPTLSRWLTTLVLRWKIRSIHSVADLQRKITSPYVFFLLGNTVVELQHKGLEYLQKDSAFLLISNHRDIVLDSALTNYCLYQETGTTFRIAAGDNLGVIPFAKDLMKLNKVFWVNRSETSPRKKLAALKQLSSYIYHSITQDRVPVWIAQREGRAKDSFDITELGVLKMLHLCERHTPLQQHYKALNAHPVSVSYEYDPCDILKAQERATTGSYEKQPGEDMRSVITGFKGMKGRVSIVIDQPIYNSQFGDEQQLAEIIDQSIIRNYHLFASNLTALRLLAESGRDEYHAALQWLQQQRPATDFTDAELERRSQQAEIAVRPFLLEVYANPCLALWRLEQSHA